MVPLTIFGYNEPVRIELREPSRVRLREGDPCPWCVGTLAWTETYYGARRGRDTLTCSNCHRTAAIARDGERP